jgi:class 3 adenylate cyclase
VTLNERQDYFGQTVNIASRVQNLANSHAIYATGSVVENPETSKLLATSGIKPLPHQASLRDVTEDLKIFEIP